MNIRLIGSAALVSASLALAGCATPTGSYGPGYGSAPGYGTSAACDACGTVTRIERSATDNSPNVAGPVIGGVVGAVAGKELARRNTDSDGRRNVATAGGAIAGAVAGNAIQNRTGSNVYQVHVRMDDGRSTVVSQSDIDGLREGSYVRIQNGRAWAQ